MDTTKLEAAYRGLLTIVESIPDATSYLAPAQDDIDWTLSHLALSDPILTAAADDILHGHPAVVDNQHAMDESAIAELIASTSHQHRVAMIRAHAHELGKVLREVPDRAAVRPVLLRIFSRDGEFLLERRMPWSDLIELRATRDIPGHATRIAAYASAHDNGSHRA